MKIAKSVTELIGHTPLLEPQNFCNLFKCKAKIFAKLEYFNPAGSIKDRVAKEMLENAMKTGQITKKSVIIEPTSGNTGIGLASIAASYGMKAIFTMPETMSVERQNLLKAFGAEIVLTEGSKGMQGSIDKANELAQNTPNSFIPAQFDNPVNPLSHYKTTGPEIWQDTDGKVDIIIAGVGTGGTISGIGQYLKEQNPNIQVIAVEPASSPLLTKNICGPHKIQGIGANFIPKNLNQTILTEVIDIENDDAFEMSRQFAKSEGILVGISAGAALKAAVDVSIRAENINKNIVVILPDTGDRYLSTELFK